jgi:SAM-dependent methyltransferase
MSEASTPHTPANWDAASASYHEQIADWTGQFAAALIKGLNPEPDSRVLEVAAGSGALTEALARSAGSVLATDFSPGMLDILRTRLSGAGVENVELAAMDGQALEVEDGSFDRAASQFGVMLFPDRARGFSELRRALAPGGRVAVMGWASPERFPAFGLFMRAVRTANPDLPPPPGPPPIFSLADPQQFTAELGAAGFREAEVEFVPRTMVTESVDSMWSMLTSGAPPAKALLDRIGPEGSARTREALSTLLTERFGNGRIEFENYATLGTAIA